jgi:hypothetical protein
MQNYGNDHIIAWLDRDGFDRLALSVRFGRVSARFGLARRRLLRPPRDATQGATAF